MTAAETMAIRHEQYALLETIEYELALTVGKPHTDEVITKSRQLISQRSIVAEKLLEAGYHGVTPIVELLEAM
jgi:hypothetical protein